MSECSGWQWQGVTGHEPADAQGLVLETRDHGERDAVVTIGPSGGTGPGIRRGVQRETSKNRRLCLPFEEVEIETEQSGTGMFRLIHGSWLRNTAGSGGSAHAGSLPGGHEAILHVQMHPALYERAGAVMEKL